MAFEAKAHTAFMAAKAFSGSLLEHAFSAFLWSCPRVTPSLSSHTARTLVEEVPPASTSRLLLRARLRESVLPTALGGILVSFRGDQDFRVCGPTDEHSLAPQKQRDDALLLMSRSLRFELTTGGGGGEADIVMRELVAFLDDLRALPAEKTPPDIVIDVKNMPLLADPAFFQSLAETVCGYSDCFEKIAVLKIETSGGLQEMLVRGALALLPPQLATSVSAP